jgi:hypothetical protein
LSQPTAISLLLKTASDIKKTHTRADHILYLRTVFNEPLRFIVQGALHPGVEWLLPKGRIDYKPASRDGDLDSKLYREYRKLYIFCKGGVDNLDQRKRENLFKQLLESVHPDDAELLLAVKDKYLPYPGIDYELFQEAYPGILPDPVKAPVAEDVKAIITGTDELTDEALQALYSKRFKPAAAPVFEPGDDAGPVIGTNTNKGKVVVNDGVKNFLVSKEEAGKWNPGRLKK